MKKNAIHFKIAAWSCKHPLYFYTFVLLSFIIFIATAFFISANWQTSSNIVTVMKPLAEKNLPSIEGWIPVSDMQLSDGVRCRLYKNDSTSVTNCYKFLDGRWEFHQSF